jgi:hypothetical protein
MCTLHETGWGTRAGISDRKFITSSQGRYPRLTHTSYSAVTSTATAALAAADKENTANGVEGYGPRETTYSDPYEMSGEPKTYHRL